MIKSRLGGQLQAASSSDQLFIRLDSQGDDSKEKFKIYHLSVKIDPSKGKTANTAETPFTETITIKNDETLHVCEIPVRWSRWQQLRAVPASLFRSASENELIEFVIIVLSDDLNSTIKVKSAHFTDTTSFKEFELNIDKTLGDKITVRLRAPQAKGLHRTTVSLLSDVRSENMIDIPVTIFVK